MQSEYKIILHMKLEDIISQSIHENGKPIGFDVFMNFALYSTRVLNLIKPINDTKKG